jgi:hypothetical protein
LWFESEVNIETERLVGVFMSRPVGIFYFTRGLEY